MSLVRTLCSGGVPVSSHTVQWSPSFSVSYVADEAIDVEAVEHEKSQFDDYRVYGELWAELLEIESAAAREELEDTFGRPEDGKNRSILGTIKLKARLVQTADVAVGGCEEKTPAADEVVAEPLSGCTYEVEGVATNGWRLQPQKGEWVHVSVNHPFRDRHMDRKVKSTEKDAIFFC